jgi:hypothetical protein
MGIVATLLVTLALPAGQRAADDDIVPPNLPADQKANLLRFLKAHEKPDKYIPPGARIVRPESSPPAELPDVPVPPNTTIKQYTVQIALQRPVPDMPPPNRVDVYYYRPNPAGGKPGITVKHTVDLTTGQQVGDTEVLLNHHSPIAREELADAIKLAREKVPAVAELYQGRDPSAVRWEYLQLMISKKSDRFEPGDRVVRLAFNAPDATPVPVIVDLTKGTAVPDAK